MDIAAKIRELEASRQAKSAQQVAIQEKASAAGRTKDDTEQQEFDGLVADIDSIDKELGDYRKMQKQVEAAKPVEQKSTSEAGTGSRDTIVRLASRTEPGIKFARMVKCMAIAKKYNRDVDAIVRERYPDDTDVQKAAVIAGSTAAGNWAAKLTGAETSVFADFAEFLRPKTLIGRFGQGGIPALRRVPFRERLLSQTVGGDAAWVGQGKAKPVTAFGFDSTTLIPLKCANIAVLAQESLDSSSPSSETLVRDSLAAALTARLDIDFIDTANDGEANVQPASITSGIAGTPSTGPDADAIRADLRALFSGFIAANNPPTQGVILMSSSTALALGLMMNGLGQPEFPGINMNGGTLAGLPVLTSEYVVSDDYGSIVVLVNAGDIYLGDEGGVAVDMSTEASLEMLDNDSGGAGKPTGSSIAPTAAQLVSLWQTNSVAFRAERTIAWKLRRASAVALLTEVSWGETES